MTSLRIALVAGVLTTAGLAHAATDQARWLSLLQKHAVHVGNGTAVDAFERAKSPCICQDGTPELHRRVGYVAIGEDPVGSVAFCIVPRFDPDGALESAAGCADFVPLLK